jgi:hypothetical protein
MSAVAIVIGNKNGSERHIPMCPNQQPGSPAGLEPHKRGISRHGRRNSWAPPPQNLRLSTIMSFVDLDVASDQRTRPIDIASGSDAESVGSPGLAAIIHFHSEAFQGCPGGPDNLGGAGESRVRVRAARTGANKESINGLGLYANPHPMVVIFKVP